MFQYVDSRRSNRNRNLRNGSVSNEEYLLQRLAVPLLKLGQPAAYKRSQVKLPYISPAITTSATLSTEGDIFPKTLLLKHFFVNPRGSYEEKETNRYVLIRNFKTCTKISMALSHLFKEIILSAWSAES